jgi:hypothetical protein
MKRFFLILLALLLAGAALSSFMLRKEEPSPHQAPAGPSVSEEETSAALPAAPPEGGPAPSPGSLRQAEDAPFTVQAPFASWADPLYENACEEASLVMAAAWLRGETALSPEAAKKEIREIALSQERRFGSAVDTSARDTEATLRDFYGVQGSEVVTLESLEDLEARADGTALLLAPAAGRLLHNPFFTPPGPEHHMLVILSYDRESDTFLVNDPGTKRGASYRYPSATLYEALRDYPSGSRHQEFPDVRKTVIVVPGSATLSPAK